MTKIARNTLLSLEEYAKQRPQIRVKRCTKADP